MALPVWLRGRDCACTLTPQSEAADGSLSAGTLLTLTGSLDEVEIEADPELEEISPMTSTRRNNVIIKDGTRIVLREILKRNGTNLLASAVVTADVFVVVLTRGAQVWSFTGRRGAYSEGLRAGKSVASLTLEMVDIGSSNPTYA